MKKLKGKSALPAIVLLLVLVIAAAIIFFLSGQFGFGSGDRMQGEDNAVSESAEESEEEQTTAPEETTVTEETVVTTVEEIAYADVTVKENGYLYQNESIELDALADELKKLDPGTRVRIKDEDASLNAYNALTAKLDELSIPYEEKLES